MCTAILRSVQLSSYNNFGVFEAHTVNKTLVSWYFNNSEPSRQKKEFVSRVILYLNLRKSQSGQCVVDVSLLEFGGN